MNITFFFTDIKVTLTKRTSLKNFINSIFTIEGKKLGSLTYVFCSDDYLLQINRSFLNHDFYTDIITFDLSDSSESIDGEIYISVDRVKDNAKLLNTSFKEELHRVIFHGALHLCGYKDKTKSQEKQMRMMEERYLSQYL